MARITSKQAKEMNEAYAKVYQNLQEKLTRFDPSKYDLNAPQGGLDNKAYNALTGREREKLRMHMMNAQNEKNLAAAGGKKDGKEVEITNVTPDGTAKKVGTNNQSTSSNSNTSGNPKAQDALNRNPGNPPQGQDGLNRNPGNPPQGTPANNNQSQQKTVTKPFDKSQDIGGTSAIADKDKITPVSSTSGPGTGSVKLPPGGLSKLAPKNNQQQSGGNQSSGGQQPQSGVNRSQTVVRDGNRTTTTTRTSADSSTPEGAKAVQDAKAAFQARREARRTGGTPPLSTQSGAKKPATGGQPPSGGQKPGLLGRLGSLAGKAVGAARNVAGNVKQGAQAVAGGIKQGAQAVSGALANKGPIQGRQTGAQRRAQQTGQTAPQATQTQQTKPVPQAQPAPQAQQARPAPQAQPAQQAKPVQAAPAPKPVPQAQPAQQQQSQRPSPMERRNARLAAAKSKGSPLKRPGAQRAMQMAKAKQSAPAPAPVAQKRPGQGGITRSSTWDSYDPVFDDTVQFLVSEGHAKDVSEAMSIMSESEFIDAFNQELNG